MEFETGMKKSHYTIKDIARLANVSRGTVDRVLHKRGKVSAKAREKVEQVLSEINYRPNVIARSLRQGKPFTLGVLLCMPDDPYWQLAMNGIFQAKHEFGSFGVTLNIQPFDPNVQEDYARKFQEILDTHPHGIAVAPIATSTSEMFLDLGLDKGVPITAFNTPVKSHISGFIGQNLYQSGRIGGELLAKMNKRGGKFVMIHMDESFEDSRIMQEKDLGFRSFFINQSGYEILSLKIDRAPLEEQNQCLTDFFQHHKEITGVLVSTSKTYWVAKIMEDMNIDANLIGYDLIPQNVHYLSNGRIDFLIHQNPHLQAYLSVKYLAEHLLFQKDIPTQTLLPIDIVSTENANFYLEIMESEESSLVSA